MKTTQADALIELCAVAAEAQDRVGREWVSDSLWDAILKRAAANVRALKGRYTLAPPPGPEYAALVLAEVALSALWTGFELHPPVRAQVETALAAVRAALGPGDAQ